jgi:hypothetical protein
MGSTATVTAFHSFVARTKAKSSEVNTNFSNFRGFFIPINPDTQTGSDNTHDLGSTDHRWRRIYLGEPPYVNGSQLGKIYIDNVVGGSVPPCLINPQDDLSRIGFETTPDSDVRFQFVVPSEYKPGNRIALTMRGYAETTGAAVFHSVAKLYQMSVTSIDGSASVPANVLTGTVTFPNSVAGLFFEDSSLKLTDSSGRINSVTVTVGQIISVNLKRATGDGSDVNSGPVYLTDLVVDLNN